MPTAQGADSELGFMTVTDLASVDAAPAGVLVDKAIPADICNDQPDSNESCFSACNVCPKIVGRVALVYFWRDKPDNINFLSSSTNQALVNGRDFNAAPTPGVDTTLTYYRTCDTGFEVRYLWLDDQCPDVSLDIPLASNSFGAMPNGNLHYAGGIPIEFTYQSKLQTFELNLRRRHAYFDLLFGFRYVDFRETLIMSVDDFDAKTWGADCNNLYGFQTGAEAVLWESSGGKFRFDGFGKAGIYYNKMSTHFESQFFGGQGTPPSSAGEASKAAFLGELGVNAAYQINRHLALRAGYQILWLSGVATAGRQVPIQPDSNNSGGQILDSSVDGNSSVIYHGANAGIEVAW
jgi:hypothetical protein